MGGPTTVAVGRFGVGISDQAIDLGTTAPLYLEEAARMVSGAGTVILGIVLPGPADIECAAVELDGVEA